MERAKTAIVFPGQGAQFAGMGKELYEISPAAKKVFDAAEDLRKGTLNQCFNGTKEELSLTLNTQPCIFTVSLAHAASLKERGITAGAVAGFSAGELSALAYAGVFSCEDGLKAVCKRAELMHERAQKQKGSMSAVMRLDEGAVLKLCAECGVFAVNFNSPGQIAVSGAEPAMAAFNVRVAESGGRAVPLAVSGAFHSPLMAEAALEFSKYLKGVKVSPPEIPVYANLTAKPYEADADAIKQTLAAQMQDPVLWRQTVEQMLADGFTEFIETEPGKVLTGLVGKIKEARK